MSRDTVGIVDETPYPGPIETDDIEFRLGGNPFLKSFKLGPGPLTTGTIVMINKLGQVVPYVNEPGNEPIGMIGDISKSPPGKVVIIPNHMIGGTP